MKARIFSLLSVLYEGILLLAAVLAPFCVKSQDVSYKEKEHTIQFRINYRSPGDSKLLFAFVPMSDTVSVLPAITDSIPWPNFTTTVPCRAGKKERIVCDLPKLPEGQSYIFWYNNGREEGSHRIRL